MDALKKRPLLVLAGPTAVGKTALSISLARVLEGEIISGDSMQVYRGMDIGTAKIKPSEMGGIKHHMLDIMNPDQDMSAALYKELVRGIIADIHSRGRIPILVGGSGFYLQAVVYDVEFSGKSGNTVKVYDLGKSGNAGNPGNFDDHGVSGNSGSFSEENTAGRIAEASKDKKTLDILNDIDFDKNYHDMDGLKLHSILEKLDPASAEAIHPNNKKRVLRALEFYRDNGSPISMHNEKEWGRSSPYDFLYVVLNMERQRLYERIDRRVDQMLEQGLVAEVESLKNAGCTEDMNSMKAIGYRQVLKYLKGEYDHDTMVSELKLDTRHFAKRQLTWFRREKETFWLQKEDFGDDDDMILQEILRNFRMRTSG